MAKKFKHIEKEAINAPVKDIEWDGVQDQTDQHELVDNGTGQPIVLRVFDFDLPPGIELPPKDELLNFHKSKVTAFLWRDELVPIMDYKLIYSKDKLHFRIFATCQAKTGSTILEKPQLLQEHASRRT